MPRSSLHPIPEILSGGLLAIAWLSTAALPAAIGQEAGHTAAFRDVNVVPMTTETVLPAQTVLVRDGTIVAVGPTGSVSIPIGAEVIDGAGRYLLPGLADMHTHINEQPVEHSVLNLFLANGVTSIRDLTQGSPPSILRLRDDVRAGLRLGPTIYVAVTIWGNEADPAEVLERQAAQGYDCVKLISFFTGDAFCAAAERARQLEVHALGHLPFAGGVAQAIACGMRESSHVLELAWDLVECDREQDLTPGQWEELILTELNADLSAHLDDNPERFREIYRERVAAVVAQVAGRDFGLCTTLVADQDIMTKLNDPDSIRAAPHADYACPRFWDDIASGEDKHLKLFQGDGRLATAIFRISTLFLEELKESGVPLVLGTDVGPTYLSIAPGFSVHDELAILVDCGLTPYEALQTCTTAAAAVVERMTGRDEFGSVQVGRRADLLLVDGNPLADLAVLRSPAGVMAAGRWLPAERLTELLAVRKTGIIEGLREAYRAEGLQASLRLYEEATRGNLDNLFFYHADTLNQLGYDLLGEGLVEEAIAVFELGVAEYPASANLLDSLAEANLRAGRKEAALTSCRKALAIDPEMPSTLRMVREIEEGD